MENLRVSVVFLPFNYFFTFEFHDLLLPEISVGSNAYTASLHTRKQKVMTYLLIIFGTNISNHGRRCSISTVPRNSSWLRHYFVEL